MLGATMMKRQLSKRSQVDKVRTQHNQRTVSRRMRLTVDVAMALVYLLQMAPYQTGGWYHEVAGLAFVGLLIVHHVLNARWLRIEVRQRDWLPLVLDAALLICVAGIAFSGMAMAQHVRFLQVEGLAHIARTAHACITYAGLMLVSVHVGLHVPHGWLEGLSVGARILVAVSALAAGVYAFVSLGVATKLSWGLSFPDGMTPLPVLVLKHVLLALPFILAGCGMAIRKRGSR